MTIKDFMKIISNLPVEAIILIKENGIHEVETVELRTCNGRDNLIFSVKK